MWQTRQKIWPLKRIIREQKHCSQNLENTSAGVTLMASLWEMTKLPIFVQMHYSHNMVSIYKRQMFVMYTSFFFLRNNTVISYSQIFLWFFHAWEEHNKCLCTLSLSYVGLQLGNGGHHHHLHVI